MSSLEPVANPLAPGGIGITRLRVYDTVCPDGIAGGSPHFHLLCTEMYVVLTGSGEVETLSAAGITRVELRPGRLVWFEPGLIHRLINHSHDLDILVVMQNNGLPEAGDFVLVFPKAILEDGDTYRRHISLAANDRVYATDQDAAESRRNLAVQGYLEWREAFETRGPTALEELYTLGRNLISDSLGRWEVLIRTGPDQATEKVHNDLQLLLAGSTDHLLKGRLANADSDPAERLGMCGYLTTYSL